MLVNLIIKISMSAALIATLIFGTSKFTGEYRVYQDDVKIESLSNRAQLKSETSLKEYKILKRDDNLLLVEFIDKDNFEIKETYKLKSRNKKKHETFEDYEIVNSFSPEKEELK